VPKDKRILTFCTGGIRCVKVNAYLKQRLGFDNIGRLKKGIIAYEKWVGTDSVNDTDAGATQLQRGGEAQAGAGIARPASLFKGENYLFDRRRILDLDVHMDGESEGRNQQP